MCEGNYKWQLSASFIIFPESNEGFRLILNLQITIISVTSSICLFQGRLHLNEIVVKSCIIMSVDVSLKCIERFFTVR